jgi:HlyD family secretion protein
MSRLVKFTLFAALCAAAVAALAYSGAMGTTDADAPRYKLATVEQGPMARTVTASGKLEAVVTVVVGSQISGVIKTLYADFNSEVTEGQLIARIDPAGFKAKLAQSEAELAVAKANVQTQKATLQELGADLSGAEAAFAEAIEELRRKQSLFAKRVVASSAVDTARSVHDQARSKVAATQARRAGQKAQIALARAQVLEKTAAVELRRLDLDYTNIRSPVNGVVIDRSVDAGQTVAASLQAPVLFTIAQDLKRMQVGVSVDEADIGEVRVGQQANFTVDAYPNATFRGAVHQVRKAGIEVSNVVTYTVVVTADNSDQRLLPGMTANVTLIISQRDNALKVANAALRYRPSGGAAGGAAAQKGPATNASSRRADRRARNIERLTKRLNLTPKQTEEVRAVFADVGKKIRALRRQGLSRDETGPAIRKLRAGMRPRIAALLTPEQQAAYRKMRAQRTRNRTRRGVVWVLDEAGKPQQMPVVYGISDGVSSEVVSSDLKPRQKIIIGDLQLAKPDNKRWRFGF